MAGPAPVETVAKPAERIKVPNVFQKEFANMPAGALDPSAESAQPVMVDRENAMLPQAVAEQVTRAGIPVTAKEITPDPLHILERAGDLIGEAAYSVGTDVQTTFKGEEPNTYDRATPGNRLHGLVNKLRGLKEALRKKQH